MQVRWVNGNGLDYPKGWDENMARMLEVMEEHQYVKLTPISQLAKQLRLDAEFEGSDQFVVFDPDDMDEKDPFETNSLGEE